MNCNDAKIKMMDFLYEELDPSEKEQFLAHADQCAGCKAEIRELGGAGQLLRSLPGEHPRKPVALPVSGPAAASPRKAIWKPVQYALAAVFLLLVTASMANLQVQYDGDGFQMNMGLFQPQPQAQTGITEEQMHYILAEREAMLIEHFRQEQQEQEEHFTLALNEFMSAVDEQRAGDLELIAMELYRLEEQTGYQLTQTDLLLYDLIENTSY